MKGPAVGKLGLLLLLLGAVAAFFLLDLGQYLTLANLKARQQDLAALAALLLQFFHPFGLTIIDLAIHFGAVLVVVAISGLLRRRTLAPA